MHAFADFDSVVIDDPDVRPKREVVVHALLGGEWHRVLPDMSETACEQPYHVMFTPIRMQKLAGKLCPTCFTELERRKAAEHDAKERIHP